ncbi:MAG: hypothetical protein J6S38_00165 [Erysipelotrichaceae bacterium]|nr:hypothetical protein [Erysipelotrichaceae bacterium]
MSDRVVYGEDGKYRWSYRVEMYKNPAIFHTVVIASAISFLFPLVVLGIIFALEGNFFEAMKDLLPIFLGIGLVMVLIVLFSYWAVSKYYGGSFLFFYEMDEEGIRFYQSKEDSEKTKNISDLAFLTGMATKNYGLMGVGMADSSTAYSRFKKLISIRANRKRELITLHSFFLYNQIFVPEADYDSVLHFMEEHSGKIAKEVDII